MLVVELLAAYHDYIDATYSADSQEPVIFLVAIRQLKDLYGGTPAADFGPKALKTVRDQMIASGLSRGTVNSYVNRIKRCFRWGVSEELIPAGVSHGLNSVEGLRRGRTQAKECPPVRPVSDSDIESTVAFLPTVVGDMVRIQRLTGARPTEKSVSCGRVI